MSRKRAKRISLALTTVVCSAGAGKALGADAQPPRGPQVAEGRAPTPQQAVHLPPPNVNETALQFSKSGGSLYKASIAALPPESPDQPHRPRETSYFAIPEQEPKTIHKHDLVCVVIREESSSSSQGNTELKRESDIDAHIDEFIKLKIANFAVYGGAQGPQPPAIKATGNRSFKSNGTEERTDSMTARMMAEVVDVKPNGTLVLQAKKTIKNDSEEQSFILTGTCRVEDLVAADNTVLSTQLYDLRLEKNTKGTVRSAAKRGLIGQLLDFINPF
jgi:flagellar L-ring protein precursor FlgH